MAKRTRLKRIKLTTALIVPTTLTLVTVSCFNQKATLFEVLNSTDFDFTKVTQGYNLSLKNTKVIQEQLELRYATSNTKPASDASFWTIVPTNVVSDTTVWVKLFIRAKFLDTYKINKQNSIALQVPIETASNDPINLTDSIQASDFTLSGTALSGTISFSPTKALASQLEVRYFVGATEPTTDTNYSATVPNTLKNGDVLHAKLFLKSNFQTGYTFTASKVSIDVTNLTKVTLVSTVNATNFEMRGASGSGQIVFKNPVTVIDDRLELRYFKGATAPSSDSSYQSSGYTDLSNGDKVWMKIFVKSSSALQYQVSFTAFSFDVSGI